MHTKLIRYTKKKLLRIRMVKRVRKCFRYEKESSDVIDTLVSYAVPS